MKVPPSLPGRVTNILYLCSLLVSSVQSQACYYPNGNVSTSTDIPCSLEAYSPCCPQGWQCLSNGLCYLENEQYLGRYTCTDPTWQSSACPQICTHDNTAAGDEAILECSPGQYCCDANRPDIDNPPQPGCCDTGGHLFSLPSGTPVPSSQSYVFSIASEPGPATSTQSQTTSASSSSTSSSTSSTSTTTQSLASSSSPTSSQLVTTTGINSVLTITTAISIATPATTSPSVSAKNHNDASIIAPAVVVPVLAIAIAALAFFLWRTRREKKRSQFAIFENYSPNRGSWAAGSKAEYPYDPSTAYKQGEAEYKSPSSSVPYQYQQHSDYAKGPVELDGREIPVELPGSSPVTPHELPAS
ncbi:hypothetical protein VTN77DRAFT_5433 [Rasamsonia byssochlamydoides]|uniref:uncharacterized protein n=1 Tax=Rasamsonia byssochlamydoides TaxID=89139 RepID=UPI003742A406